MLPGSSGRKQRQRRRRKSERTPRSGMNTVATPVSAMVHPLAAPSSSICLQQGQARRQNPLFRPHFRQIRRPLRSAHKELQTSEPSTETTASTSIRTHRVTVHDRERGVVHEFLVPEDQYILHTAEAQNISLPFACRHGCCTSCAVRVKSGQIRQPEALGISAELKDKGYALLCVGFPSSDIEVETQDEDEVYWLQFGQYFARGPVERDDYALELAMGDE